MGKNISLPEDFQIIGYQATEAIRKKLEQETDCFGQMYSKESDICGECVAPVIIKGQLRLMNEVCKSYCKKDKAPANYRKLTSNQIKTLLQRGATLSEIFRLMIKKESTEDDIKEARKCLRQRLYYLENAKNYPTPGLPPLEELLDG